MINYDFYNQNKENEQMQNKNFFVENYINKYENDSYLLNCSDDYNYDIIYNLSSISQNIINWYDFKTDSKILQIESEFGNITEALLDNKVDLTVCTNSKYNAQAIEKRNINKRDFKIYCADLKDIKFEQKFDYIILIGNLPLRKELYGEDISTVDYLKFLAELLDEDGRIILSVDNKFGVKYFAGSNDPYTGKKFDSVTGYVNEKNKHYTYSRKKIKDMLVKAGLENMNFYYPMPDYRLPNIIFSDKSIPNSTNFDRYEPYTRENEEVFLNEIQMLREILKEDSNNFKLFCNSFLIEASKKEIELKYRCISFNNMRKAKYRLLTRIGEEFVSKQATNVFSNEHYCDLKNNLEIFKEDGYKTLDFIDGDIFKSKYENSERMMTNILSEYLENENYDEFYKLVDAFINLLKEKTHKLEENEKTVFDKYKINVNNPEKYLYLKHGFWDANFSNCFYIDNEFVFFDQEWLEENLPLEYIVYKCFYYNNSIRRYLDFNDIVSRYGLSEDVEELEKLDKVLQEEIRDDKILDFYKNINLVNWNSHMDSYNERVNETIRMKSEIEHLKNIIAEKENVIKMYENKKISNKIRRVFRRK